MILTTLDDERSALVVCSMSDTTFILRGNCSALCSADLQIPTIVTYLSGMIAFALRHSYNKCLLHESRVSANNHASGGSRLV